MSAGLNKVMLLGNLGADPELRVLGTGQAVMRLRIATSESYLDRSNTRQERTEWHSVVVWGKRAEGLAKFLAKGMRIFVEGKLQTRTYEKSGEKKYATEVVASNVLMASSGGPKGEQRTLPPAVPGGAASQASDDFDYGGGYGDDDIPFIVDAQRRGWGRP